MACPRRRDNVPVRKTSNNKGEGSLFTLAPPNLGLYCAAGASHPPYGIVLRDNEILPAFARGKAPGVLRESDTGRVLG